MHSFYYQEMRDDKLPQIYKFPLSCATCPHHKDMKDHSQAFFIPYIRTNHRNQPTEKRWTDGFKNLLNSVETCGIFKMITKKTHLYEWVFLITLNNGITFRHK